ncbi:MAG: nitrile hydratase subunit alpha [Candidatus Dormibacteraceae bacterium]
MTRQPDHQADRAHDHHHDGHGHHPEPPTPIEARVRGLESLLLEKGLVTGEAIDTIIAAYESDIGPLNGARVVARAWVDPDFKSRLLENGSAAIAELGIAGLRGEHLVVVENRAGVHNVIVCTLCSCYPWAVLGLPPQWYKSPAYRSRMVIEPREVLAEFGLEIGPETAVEVWDSTAETRYMVLPERPPGTGAMREAQLAALVTRDSMIGVALPNAPVPA